MTDLFIAELLPFTIAILLMFGIAILEGVGMLLGATISSLLDSILPDFDVNISVDTSHNALTKILGWMNIGRVPILVIIVVFLACFGLIGLIIQSMINNIFGIYLNIFISSISVFILSLPITKFFTNIIRKIIPKDETSAISTNDFIGKVATITLGQASKGKPAEAKFTDIYGQTHYLMVQPYEDNVVFKQGESVIISSKYNTIFYAIKNENNILK